MSQKSTSLILGVIAGVLILYLGIRLYRSGQEISQLESEIAQQELLNKQLSSKLTVVNADLENKALIPESVVTETLERQYASIIDSVQIYQHNLAVIMEQAGWYHKNVTPYVEKYGGLITKALKITRFVPLPVPYMQQVLRGLNESLEFAGDLNRLASTISEFNRSLAQVERVYLRHRASPSRETLLDLGTILGSDYEPAARALYPLVKNVEGIFSFATSTVLSVKEYKDLAQKTGGDLADKIPFWKDQTITREIGSLFDVSDSVDSLLDDLKARSQSFKDAALLVQKFLLADIEQLSQIRAVLHILSPATPIRGG